MNQRPAQAVRWQCLRRLGGLAFAARRRPRLDRLEQRVLQLQPSRFGQPHRSVRTDNQDGSSAASNKSFAEKELSTPKPSLMNVVISSSDMPRCAIAEDDAVMTRPGGANRVIFGHRGRLTDLPN